MSRRTRFGWRVSRVGRWALLLVVVAVGVAVGLATGGLGGVVQASGHGSAVAGAGGRTWYVRPDGGDRKQCTGLVDAAYRGHGSGQPCAVNNLQWLYTNGEYGNKQWVVQGGETVVLREGQYRIGYLGPDAKSFPGLCPGDPYGCYMPPVPSGTREHPTRLLGEHYASCGKKTQIFGGYAVGLVLNLQGSQYVDAECLELTDHSQCTRFGGVSAADTCSSSYPLSDYAGSGIGTDEKTGNVLLKNLDIHGFLQRGIIGALGGDVYAEQVRIAFNGSAGWDFDNGSGQKSAATAFVHGKNLTVEWNGCNEEFPVRHAVPAYSCFDQDHGGYGDGVGTPDTPLNFTCDHCTFAYNTQDGLDLLHVSGGVIEVTNSVARGNMGQQWKMGAMQRVEFRNNVTVHNCRRMSAAFPGAPENYHEHLGLFCRASGDGIAFAVQDGGTYRLLNNSYVGYGTTTYDMSCGAGARCSTANVVFENNLHIGYKDPASGQLPAVFYADENMPKNPFRVRDHNIYFRMRTCPSGAGDRCVDPKVVSLPAWTGEASLDGVDLHLQAGSPARGSGVAVPGVLTDFDEAARSGAVDIGAFQGR